MPPEIILMSPKQAVPIAVRCTPLRKLLVVTSGKGGVGKTFFLANLAEVLARRGHRVLVLDFDLGLANLDVVLNLYPKFTLHDVFTGISTLTDALMETPSGFDVLLGGSAHIEYARLAPDLREKFLNILTELQPSYDLILMDTGAGLTEAVLFAASLASELLILTTPEPTSLTDAYATIKMLVSQLGRHTLRVVVNQTSRLGDGRTVTTQLQQVLDRFVKPERSQAVKLVYTGEIPADPCVRQAVMRRQLLMKTMPGCPAALAIQQIAVQIEHTLIKP